MPLPYQTTKVSASITIAHIEDSLKNVGFHTLGRLSKNGSTTVIASCDDASFRWTVDTGAVRKAHRDSYVRGPAKPMTEEQAERIAWRYVYHSVKALTDSIKLGIISISQAFGGQALLADGTTVADKLVQMSVDGQLKAPAMGFLEYKR